MSRNPDWFLATVFCLAGLALPGSLVAQALTPAFTYQGELRLASGPATGSYDLQFRLYNSPTGTTQIGATVTASGVAVANGLFAVPLDFGPAQFAGDRQWLEIAVRAAGSGGFETLTPRTELTAAPYAWGAAVALANSVTTTSVVDGTIQGGDLAPGAVGTTQINASQVQRRVSGSCVGTQGVQAINPDGSVACASFAGGAGTVTSIATGAGLTGGPITTSGTISVAPGGIGTTQINASQVQRRVTGTCGGSQFIRQVAEDGSVVCGGVAMTLDWSLTGNAGTNPATNFIGTTDGQPVELRANNQRMARFESVLLSGPAGGYTANVTLGSPENAVGPNVRGATISGGGVRVGDSDPAGSNDGPNRVTAHYGTVSGGWGNQAGGGNEVSGTFATIGGGNGNTVTGTVGTIGGGSGNEVRGRSGTIAGGIDNYASGVEGSAVGGGTFNTASSDRSVVGGGVFNTASGAYSTVSGGRRNCAGGAHSWAGGRRAKVRPGSASGDPGTGGPNTGCVGVSLAADADGDRGTFVWADDADADFTSTGANQFLVRASGGVGFNTTAPLTDFDVVGNRSGHAALIRNNGSTSPDGLAIRLNVAGNPTTTNNFLTFQKADGASVGSVEGNGVGGVTFNTSGGDYAEYLPLAENVAKAQIVPGMVVAIRGGRVSLDTAGAEQLGVVSTNPAISGNDPGAARRDTHVLVAFLGQVDVAVSGPVNAGDYLIASGGDDGRAIAVPAARLGAELLADVIGAAWTASAAGKGVVRALIGLSPAAAAQAAVLARQAAESASNRDAVSRLAAENAGLRADLLALRAESVARDRDLAELRARLDAFEARLGGGQ